MAAQHDPSRPVLQNFSANSGDALPRRVCCGSSEAPTTDKQVMVSPTGRNRQQLPLRRSQIRRSPSEPGSGLVIAGLFPWKVSPLDLVLRCTHCSNSAEQPPVTAHGCGDLSSVILSFWAAGTPEPSQSMQIGGSTACCALYMLAPDS